MRDKSDANHNLRPGGWTIEGSRIPRAIVLKTEPTKLFWGLAKWQKTDYEKTVCVQIPAMSHIHCVA